METNHQRKILLAVDGSDQALEAVRYLSTMVSSDRTDIVLFNVGTGFPDVFWDMNSNPLYQSKKQMVMGWLADHQLVIGEFKEKAYKILHDAGFTENNVHIKTQTKKTAVFKDIIQESYQGYSAVVVGKTGISRVKDMVLGSMAIKLAEKIKHIPTVIVGGKPLPGKVLIALDDSIESMRAVSCIADLTQARDLEISICHCLHPPAMSAIKGGRADREEKTRAWKKYNENRFKPYMEEAAGRLLDHGVDAERISTDFLFARDHTVHKIAEFAARGKFGTIVVGRRDAISFIEAYLHGRFSENILKRLHNIAVWVVG